MRYNQACAAVVPCLMPDDRLTDHLRRLVDARLLVPAAAGQFTFQHALTRDAAYASLLRRDRQIYHRLAAEAIEAVFAGALDPYVEDLSYHYYHAECWDQAAQYARLAGDKALGVYAPQIAVEHYSRALQAASALGQPPPPDLLRARGHGHETLGNFELALADYEAAMYGSAGDDAGEWQALMDLGFLWSSRDYERAGGYFERALERARRLGDRSRLAHSLNRVGNCLVNAERPVEARGYHLEALAIFEEMDDHTGIAETLDLLGLVGFIGGDLLAGRDFYLSAAEHYRRLDNRRGLSTSLIMLHLAAGDAQSDAAVWAEPERPESGRLYLREEALDLARGIRWRAGEAFALAMMSFYATPHGQFGLALDSARASLDLARQIEHRQWESAAWCALGCAHAELLALSEAQVELERALDLAQQSRSGVWVGFSLYFLAHTCLMDGHLERTARLLDQLLPSPDAMNSLTQRQAWCVQIGLYLQQGQPEAALEAVDRLAARTPHLAGRGESAVPRLALLRGQALMGLGRHAEAERSLLAGLVGAYGLEQRTLQWRLHLALARLCQAAGQAGQAAHQLAQAQTVVDAMAASLPEGPSRQAYVEPARAVAQNALSDC
jgi:tetratricopeptide (TPR) repeat protein